MGGAADLPHRSSSPLKRPASDLDADVKSGEDDVNMIVESEPSQSQSADTFQKMSRSNRAQSIDMLSGETGGDLTESAPQSQVGSSAKSVDTGSFLN
jgi:ubiquitin carboxyl-terminal hydrolase 4/11/15